MLVLRPCTLLSSDVQSHALVNIPTAANSQQPAASCVPLAVVCTASLVKKLAIRLQFFPLLSRQT